MAGKRLVLMPGARATRCRPGIIEAEGFEAGMAKAPGRQHAGAG
jgi:hypothetical protein